jgi:hypothetical protein
MKWFGRSVLILALLSGAAGFSLGDGPKIWYACVPDVKVLYSAFWPQSFQGVADLQLDCVRSGNPSIDNSCEFAVEQSIQETFDEGASWVNLGGSTCTTFTRPCPTTLDFSSVNIVRTPTSGAHGWRYIIRVYIGTCVTHEPNPVVERIHNFL